MSLPFAPSTQALNLWVKELRQFGSHRASSMLCEVLQTLYKQPLDPETNLMLLNTLAVPVIFYADELESLLAKHQASENTLSRKTAALSGHLLRLLCLNYDKLSLILDSKRTQQLTTLYNGLHIIGLWQRKQAVFNQCPSKTAWKMTAEFFQRAQRYQLLDETDIQTPIKDIPQRSIAEILQRNILFELCNPYHFKPTVIHKLFAFANSYFALLNLTVPAQQAHFAWPYRQLKAPSRYVKSTSTNTSKLFANCQAIADLLATQKPLNLSNEDLSFLRQYLIGYKDIIDSAVHTTFARCKLTFDYFQIHENLNHRTAVNNIIKASSKTGAPAPSSSAFQLLPLEAPMQKHKQLNTSSNNPYSYSLHPTQTKHYFVTSVATDLELQCDSLLLFAESDINVKLGIVRQMTVHPVNISQHILIEHIPGRVDSVQIIVDEEAGLGILITKSAEEQELILPPGKYQPGIKLVMIKQSQQKTYYLTELLQFSAYYLHFKISPD